MFIFVLCVFSLGAVQEAQWFKIETSRFTVYFKGKETLFPQKVARQAESDNSRLWREWGYEESARTDQVKYGIYLFDNRKDYLDATGRSEWSQSAASYGDFRRIAGRRDSKTFLKSELPHEIGHLLFREMLGAASQSLPAWIDEGVALMSESGKRKRFENVLRDAIQSGKAFPLAQLNLIRKPNDLDKESLLIFYAESWSFVDFLTERFGKDRFIRFCKSLVKNGNLDLALAEISSGTYPTAQSIEKQWKYSIPKKPVQL